MMPLREARSFLEEALAQFSAIPESASALDTAALGLDALVCAAVRCDDLTDVDGDLAERCRLALIEAVPFIAEQAPAEISPDRLHIALGFCAALLLPTIDDFRVDRLLHGTLLITELQAAICRARLRRRGDPLGRIVAVHQAWAAPRPSSAHVQ